MSCIIRFTAVSKKEEYHLLQLLQSGDVQRFLEWDSHFVMADNYLIAVALIYMLRAKYSIEQYSYFNLMVALYLAHEVEEEDLYNRPDFIWAAFGSSSVNLQSYRLFMSRKEKLWKDMSYNVIVKREEAESVMSKILRSNFAIAGRSRAEQDVWSSRVNRKRAASVSTTDSGSSADSQPVPIRGRGNEVSVIQFTGATDFGGDFGSELTANAIQ